MNQGKVNQGKVNQGKVDQGKVDQGKVDQGKVDQGRVEQERVDQGRVDQEKLLSHHEESNLRPLDSALRCSTTESQRLHKERGNIFIKRYKHSYND